MYKIGFTSTFKKQYFRYQHNERVQKEFAHIMGYFINDRKIDTKYKDHQLKGYLKEYREFHLFPDIIVVYEKDEQEKKITFSQIGSHSNLFK